MITKTKIAVLCIIFASQIIPAFCANENGWILTQRSKVFGDQYIYISTNGVKCINPKQGTGWLTQAPNWNITFFNDKTKLYYPVSYSTWKGKIEKNGLLPRNIKWTKVSSGSIAGIKASKFEMTNSTNTAGQTTKWLSANYWLADEINVPPRLAQLVSNTCGLPDSNSIPLELSYRDQKGLCTTLLNTYRQQQANIPDSYFSLPAGYKPAKNEVEVLVSQENRAFIEDLANDLTNESPKNRQLKDMAKSFSSDNTKNLPQQINLPGGKTINKQQITNFLNKLK